MEAEKSMENFEENLSTGIESYSEGNLGGGGSGQPGMESNIPNQLTNYPAGAATDFCAPTVPYMTPLYQGSMGYVPPTSF